MMEKNFKYRRRNFKYDEFFNESDFLTLNPDTIWNKNYTENDTKYGKILFFQSN